jgi:dolichol-phosphate mannosyltransferase
MNLSIIIPCYNEVENIPKLKQEFQPAVLELLKEYPLIEVVFVDDGSRDGTFEALKAAFGPDQNLPFEVQLAQHKTNRGLGAAMRTGFAASRGAIIVTTDSDGTYRYSTISELLACLEPGIDLVTASPYHPRGGVAGVPAFRLILSRGSSLIYRILLGKSIFTYTALFRAYRRQVIDRVPFASDGFLAGTEILVNSMLMGYRVAEYPAVLHSRVAGISKAKIKRTILAHLRFQWRLLLHQLRLESMITPTIH